MATKLERLALAQKITRDLFALGDEHDDKVHRIEFKGGEYPDKETNLGGMNETALVVFFEAALRRYGA